MSKPITIYDCMRNQEIRKFHNKINYQIPLEKQLLILLYEKERYMNPRWGDDNEDKIKMRKRINNYVKKYFNLETYKRFLKDYKTDDLLVELEYKFGDFNEVYFPSPYNYGDIVMDYHTEKLFILIVDNKIYNDLGTLGMSIDGNFRIDCHNHLNILDIRFANNVVPNSYYDRLSKLAKTNKTKFEEILNKTDPYYMTGENIDPIYPSLEDDKSTLIFN